MANGGENGRHSNILLATSLCFFSFCFQAAWYPALGKIKLRAGRSWRNYAVPFSPGGENNKNLVVYTGTWDVFAFTYSPHKFTEGTEWKRRMDNTGQRLGWINVHRRRFIETNESLVVMYQSSDTDDWKQKTKNKIVRTQRPSVRRSEYLFFFLPLHFPMGLQETLVPTGANRCGGKCEKLYGFDLGRHVVYERAVLGCAQLAGGERSRCDIAGE